MGQLVCREFAAQKLPFVVIDLVISSILVSMGMFTLPPVVVSTPLKLLLFILVGGWDLVVVSLAESSILSAFGWMTFVICCTKASQELSWRNALRSLPRSPEE